MFRINGTEPLRVRVNGNEVDSVVVHKDRVTTEVWSSGFTLHIATITNVSFSIRRTASPKGGRLITLTDGARIYEGDVLSISCVVTGGDLLSSIVCNNSRLGTGTRTKTVSGDVDISADIWRKKGTLYIGSAGWETVERRNSIFSNDSVFPGFTGNTYKIYSPIDLSRFNYEAGKEVLIKTGIYFKTWSEDMGGYYDTSESFDIYYGTYPTQAKDIIGNLSNNPITVVGAGGKIAYYSHQLGFWIVFYQSEDEPTYLKWQLVFQKDSSTSHESDLILPYFDNGEFYQLEEN